jgi:hypothetical protein
MHTHLKVKRRVQNGQNPINKDAYMATSWILEKFITLCYLWPSDELI